MTNRSGPGPRRRDRRPSRETGPDSEDSPSRDDSACESGDSRASTLLEAPSEMGRAGLSGQPSTLGRPTSDDEDTATLGEIHAASEASDTLAPSRTVCASPSSAFGGIQSSPLPYSDEDDLGGPGSDLHGATTLSDEQREHLLKRAMKVAKDDADLATLAVNLVTASSRTNDMTKLWIEVATEIRTRIRGKGTLQELRKQREQRQGRGGGE